MINDENGVLVGYAWRVDADGQAEPAWLDGIVVPAWLMKSVNLMRIRASLSTATSSITRTWA